MLAPPFKSLKLTGEDLILVDAKSGTIRPSDLTQVPSLQMLLSVRSCVHVQRSRTS